MKSGFNLSTAWLSRDSDFGKCGMWSERLNFWKILSGYSEVDLGLGPEVHLCPAHCTFLHKYLISLCQIHSQLKNILGLTHTKPQAGCLHRLCAPQMCLPPSPCSLVWGSPHPDCLSQQCFSQVPFSHHFVLSSHQMPGTLGTPRHISAPKQTKIPAV